MDNVGHPSSTSHFLSQTEATSPMHASPRLPGTRRVEIGPPLLARSATTTAGATGAAAGEPDDDAAAVAAATARRTSATESSGTTADVEDAYEPSSSGAASEGLPSPSPSASASTTTHASRQKDIHVASGAQQAALAHAAGSGGSIDHRSTSMTSKQLGGSTGSRSAFKPSPSAPALPPPSTSPPPSPVSGIPRPSGLQPGKLTRARSHPISPLTPPSTPAQPSTNMHTSVGPASGGGGGPSTSNLSPSPPLSPRSQQPSEGEPSTSSEVERELALAQREGRVVYETAGGKPLVPLGDVAEAPPGGQQQPVARLRETETAVTKERAAGDEEVSAEVSQGGQREGLKADLDRYHTMPSAPLAPSTLLPSHLPNLAFVSPTAPTSLPLPATAVQHDLDHSLGQLLSEDVFWEMLRNPLGRHRFRAYLMGLGKEEVLDLWWDAELCEQIAKMVRDGASAIQAVYFDSTNGALERLCPGSERQLVHAQGMDSSFSALSKAVLKGMYTSHFKDFVRRKLVEQSQVKLGMTGGAEREGIGEIWCVSNPRLRDHPLVLVSEAFCKMTGYRAEAILGRNCRFLQGPGTSPGSVQRIRQAIAAGEEHTELLLNYRSSGEPFWNLLAMIPLRARDGSVAYFVGGQIDVTGSIQSSRRLSFLIGGAASTYSAEGIPKLNTFEFSPTLVAHRPMLAKDLRDFQGVDADSADREIVASQARDQQQRGRSLGGLSSHARQELEGPSYESSTEGGSSAGARPPKTIFDRLKQFVGAGPTEKVDDQLLSPAEKSWQSVGPLQPQIDLFSSTYRKLLVLRPQGHEILYVTRSLIAFLGLPIISSQDLFSCSILHTDLLSLLELSSREATRRARDKIRNAIRASEAVSLVVGLRVLPQSVFTLGLGSKKTRESAASEGLKRVALHLTPLTDRDGVTGAYICIVS